MRAARLGPFFCCGCDVPFWSSRGRGLVGRDVLDGNLRLPDGRFIAAELAFYGVAEVL